MQSVTGILIGINLLVYIAMVLRGVSPTDPSIEQILKWGANFGPYTLDHQGWRLVTCVFLHIGIVHLLLNMWALFNVGPLAEMIYGRWNFLWMYMVCGLSGSLASLFWDPGVTSAGASGAIFGIIGALIATLYFDKVRIPRQVSGPILSSLVASAIAVLFYGFVKTGIDNGAHIGGLVSGLALGTLLGRYLERSESAARMHKLFLGGSIVVLLAFGAFVWRHNGYVVPLQKAEAALASGKPDAALPFVDKAVEEKPNDAGILFLRGDILLRLNRAPEAEQEFKHVLEVNPKSARAWNALGRIYLRQNDWPRAADAFTKGTQIRPESPENWYDLGLTLQKENRPQDAVAMLKRAAQLRPDAPEYWFTLGLTSMSAKQYDEAIPAFQQASKLLPRSPEPLVWLANAYSAKGMAAEAGNAYAQAQELARAKTPEKK